MKKIFKIKKKWATVIYTTIFCMLLLFSCIYLDSIVYEPSVKAGEMATFTMKVRVEPAGDGSKDDRLVVGFLVPKLWNAKASTKVTYTCTLFPGAVRTMSLIPNETLPKNGAGLTWDEALRDRYGFGPNVLDDMEWLVYWTDDVESVTVRENFIADVKFETRIGSENMRVKLGFFVNNANDGLGGDQRYYKVMYTDCFEVTNGEGIPMDFCEPHLNMFIPSSVTKEDIVTIKFQGGIKPNALDGINDVYLCATAYTDNGNTYEVTNRSIKSKMTKEGVDGRTFSLSCWLGNYFSIPENESIVRIEYFFSNEDGSKWVKETDENDIETLFITPCICK